MNGKILLTGATGFIGSVLLKELLSKRFQVIILLRPSSNLSRIAHLKGFQMFYLEDDNSNMLDLFKNNQVEIIVHLATNYGRNDPSKVKSTNVDLPTSLIATGSYFGLKTFINTDSFSSRYHTSHLRQYNESKRIFLDFLISQRHLRVINMELEHVYGEDDSQGKFFTFLLEKMFNNEPYIELTAGIQRRDFIYVGDVADAYVLIIKSLDRLEGYNSFQVGTGTSIPLREFVETLHKISKTKSELIFGAIKIKEDEILDSKADNRSLMSLGWRPTRTLENALNKIVASKKRDLKSLM